MKYRTISFLSFCVLLCLLTQSAQAQWVTQQLKLKGGWNAVYLNVDPSYATISDLVTSDPNNPVDEVWMWRIPTSGSQFIDSPQVPTDPGTQWINWGVNLAGSSPLQRMIGNTAFLVHIPTNQPSFTWSLKGKPVAPDYAWTISGLNFIGFQTRSDVPPTFEAFLGRNPNLQQNAEIFYYPGGELGAGNPAKLFDTRTRTVNRGEAYWIRSGTYFNKYFAPFEVSLQDHAGVVFGQKVSQYRFRLRNLANVPITLRLDLLASESAPSGQPAIAGLIPMIVRGDLNPTNITYGYSNLVGHPTTWTLAAAGQVNSEKEIVVGVNRFDMNGAPGDVYAGVLRFTDSLGYSQVDVPANAAVSSTAGLWVGNASVTHVRQYLKSFQKDTAGTPVLGSDGKYVLTGLNTNFGAVPRPFDLRLIMHRDTNGANVLMQRVYYGMSVASNTVVALSESALHPGFIDSARRISAVHLPFTAGNTPWQLNGQLAPGTNATAIIDISHGDQTANPFLHTYHPDHDNMNATFDSPLDRGVESYSIKRAISLSVTPPGADFDAITGSGDTLVGAYAETITLGGIGSEQRQYDSAGFFLLRKLSDIGTLTP